MLRRAAREAENSVGATPLVSLLVPAYNESALIEKNLAVLCDYLKSIESEYRWELVVVNDGSTDRTGELADAFAESHENVRVLHHPSNFGLGQALRFGFRNCRGDYIVTLDLDLSYAPEHIAELLGVMRRTGAKVVAASPYMEGGRITNVPWLRRVMSVWANRFLSFAAKGSLSTLTGMVRAYDGRFLRSLSLRSMGHEINPEIVHKATLLRGKIEEHPAHLDWSLQRAPETSRRSSVKIVAQTASVLLSGFLFRPVVFFIVPGTLLLLFALYVGVWAVIHFLGQWPNFTQYTWFLDRASAALAASFAQFPHTFIVGAISLLLALQLLMLGILSLQSKSYFEELFSISSALHRLEVEREQRATDWRNE
ncbi:MAG: glycosyltransferase family 2 protein [Vicinamibacteria bacterium]